MNSYRALLNDLNNDDIRYEYEQVWGGEDGDDFTADELIEKMVAMDQDLERRGL